MRTPGDSRRESEALQLARLQGAVASAAGEEQLLPMQAPQQFARDPGSTVPLGRARWFPVAVGVCRDTLGTASSGSSDVAADCGRNAARDFRIRKGGGVASTDPCTVEDRARAGSTAPCGSAARCQLFLLPGGGQAALGKSAGGAAQERLRWVASPGSQGRCRPGLQAAAAACVEDQVTTDCAAPPPRGRTLRFEQRRASRRSNMAWRRALWLASIRSSFHAPSAGAGSRATSAAVASPPAGAVDLPVRALPGGLPSSLDDILDSKRGFDDEWPRAIGSRAASQPSRRRGETAEAVAAADAPAAAVSPSISRAVEVALAIRAVFAEGAAVVAAACRASRAILRGDACLHGEPLGLRLAFVACAWRAAAAECHGAAWADDRRAYGRQPAPLEALPAANSFENDKAYGPWRGGPIAFVVVPDRPADRLEADALTLEHGGAAVAPHGRSRWYFCTGTDA